MPLLLSLFRGKRHWLHVNATYLQWTPEQRQKEWESLCREESSRLRQRRTRHNAGDFQLLTQVRTELPLATELGRDHTVPSTALWLSSCLVDINVAFCERTVI
jgi:endonuclease/exonuclease/phosphatase family metal-dependent hydrolase